MILTGPAIRAAISKKRIVISPFDKKQLNDASYDLRLGNKVAVYKNNVCLSRDANTCFGGTASERLSQIERDPSPTPVDAAKAGSLHEFELAPGDPVVLKPGIGYLMHTAERVVAYDHIPVLDGKSSIGRLFVSAHVTAGYGEPGFDGQWTLEVTCQFPVILYVGMRIGQIRFHVPKGDISRYKGRYRGDAAFGPVGSRAFQQIEEDVADKRLTLRRLFA